MPSELSTFWAVVVDHDEVYVGALADAVHSPGQPHDGTPIHRVSEVERIKPFHMVLQPCHVLAVAIVNVDQSILSHGLP